MIRNRTNPSTPLGDAGSLEALGGVVARLLASAAVASAFSTSAATPCVSETRASRRRNPRAAAELSEFFAAPPPRRLCVALTCEGSIANAAHASCSAPTKSANFNRAAARFARTASASESSDDAPGCDKHSPYAASAASMSPRLKASSPVAFKERAAVAKSTRFTRSRDGLLFRSRDGLLLLVGIVLLDDDSPSTVVRRFRGRGRRRRRRLGFAFAFGSFADSFADVRVHALDSFASNVPRLVRVHALDLVFVLDLLERHGSRPRGRDGRESNLDAILVALGGDEAFAASPLERRSAAS